MNQLLENYSTNKTKRVLFATISTNTNTAGTVLDLSGIKANALSLTFDVLARTDGVYTPIIEANDTNSFAADPSATTTYVLGDDNFILAGTAGALVLTGKMAAIATGLSAANKQVRVGLINRVKNYVKVTIKSTGVTSGATILVYADIQKDEISPSNINY